MKLRVAQRQSPYRDDAGVEHAGRKEHLRDVSSISRNIEGRRVAMQNLFGSKWRKKLVATFKERIPSYSRRDLRHLRTVKRTRCLKDRVKQSTQL
jgi:hypothetical protein